MGAEAYVYNEGLWRPRVDVFSHLKSRPLNSGDPSNITPQTFLEFKTYLIIRIINETSQINVFCLETLALSLPVGLSGGCSLIEKSQI
jgi:hypothetical protein